MTSTQFTKTPSKQKQSSYASDSRKSSSLSDSDCEEDTLGVCEGSINNQKENLNTSNDQATIRSSKKSNKKNPSAVSGGGAGGQPQSSSSSQNKKQVVDENYKTELCKNFETSQKCKYGPKCQFAHGKSELSGKKVENKPYQIIQCENFFQEGTCAYGTRCHFQHDTQMTVTERINKNYYQKKLINFQLYEEIAVPSSTITTSAVTTPSNSATNSTTNGATNNQNAVSTNTTQSRRLPIFQEITRENQKKLQLTNNSFLTESVTTNIPQNTVIPEAANQKQDFQVLDNSVSSNNKSEEIKICESKTTSSASSLQISDSGSYFRQKPAVVCY